MKKTILLVLLIASIKVTNGQKNAKVTIGPEIKGSSVNASTSLACTDGSAYYLLMSHKKGMFGFEYDLRKINATTLSEILTVAIPTEKTETGVELNFHKLVYINGNLLVFKHSYDKEKETQALYAGKLNSSTLEQEGKLTKIAELTNYSDRFIIDDDGNSVFVKIVKSDNIHIMTFDGTLKLISEKNENKTPTLAEAERKANEEKSGGKDDRKVHWGMNFKTSDVRIESDLSDKEGNSFVLTWNKTGEGKFDYVHHVKCKAATSGDIIDYEIKLTDKVITEIELLQTDKGDIIVCGFYSTIEDEEKLFQNQSTEGVFYQLLDPKTKNVKISTVKAFDIKFVTLGMKDDEAEKLAKQELKGKNATLYAYSLDHTLLRKSGSVVLIAEQTYINKLSNSMTNNYANNIAVIEIGSNGEIVWNTKIMKMQQSTDDFGMSLSYSLLANENDKDIHFIYSDTKENALKTEGKLMTYTPKSKDGVLVMTTVHADGNQHTEILVDTDQVDVKFQPRFKIKISANELMYFGEKSSTDQFVKITLQ